MSHPSLGVVSDTTTHPGWLPLVFAAACGLVVANLYYAQPLVGPISAALSLPPQLAGLIVTLTQVGYGIGLLFLVPVADIVENRRLVALLLGACAIALAAAAVSANAVVFFAAAAVIGLTAVAVQILVPFAAHLAPDARRGRVVGNVMSGLLLGIMLARPVASLVTSLWGWHAVFAGSALITALVAAVLARVLPRRQPSHRLHYADLVGSMWGLLWSHEILRRRGIYHAFLFAGFSLFWTAVPLLLASPAFGLGQRGIALFALVGVSGAIAAPISGRLADRGLMRPVTIASLALVALAFLLARVGLHGSNAALAGLTLAAVILDFGVSANLVVSQRAIFALGAEYRSRLNGLFMALFFAGGALGSALGGWAYASGGWSLACWIGFTFPLLSFAYFATERKRHEA